MDPPETPDLTSPTARRSTLRTSRQPRNLQAEFGSLTPQEIDRGESPQELNSEESLAEEQADSSSHSSRLSTTTQVQMANTIKIGGVTVTTNQAASTATSGLLVTFRKEERENLDAEKRNEFFSRIVKGRSTGEVHSPLPNHQEFG